MIKFMFIIFFLFVSSLVFAADIYTYTDQDGKTIISNKPVPQKYRKKVKTLETYKQPQPEKTEEQHEQQAIPKTQAAEDRPKKNNINKKKLLDPGEAADKRLSESDHKSSESLVSGADSGSYKKKKK